MMDELTSQDAFNLLCGPKLGEGIHRTVFLCRIDPSLVVKVETESNYWTGANAAEFKNWEEVSYAPVFNRWLAPCVSISPNGRIMLQKRTTAIPAHLMPDKLPSWLTDIKHENFGFFQGRVVAHDYPQINSTWSKRLRKATW